MNATAVTSSEYFTFYEPDLGTSPPLYGRSTLPGLLFQLGDIGRTYTKYAQSAETATDGGSFLVCPQNPSEDCQLFARSCRSDAACASIVPGTRSATTATSRAETAVGPTARSRSAATGSSMPASSATTATTAATAPAGSRAAATASRSSVRSATTGTAAPATAATAPASSRVGSCSKPFQLPRSGARALRAHTSRDRSAALPGGRTVRLQRRRLRRHSGLRTLRDHPRLTNTHRGRATSPQFQSCRTWSPRCSAPGRSAVAARRQHPPQHRCPSRRRCSPRQCSWRHCRRRRVRHSQLDGLRIQRGNRARLSAHSWRFVEW